MSTLYLDRQDLRLKLDGQRLVVEEPGKRPQGIPLSHLERVVVQGRVGLDSALLGAFGERGIGVQFLSARQSRQRGFLVGPGHADARRRLAQYALVTDTPRRLAWSRQVVAGKLDAQAALLRRALERRPERRKPLSDALGTLAQVSAGLEAAADLEVLRGLEGAGAAAYFAAFAQLFPASLGCTGRNRRPPRDPVNAALSLGYTLLHNEAVRAAHRAGLDPLLGFFHEPALGRESLACDLIEPLRPRLDRWVWWLFRERVVREHHFVADKGAVLLNKEGRRQYFAGYEPAARRFRRYLRMQAYRLAKQLLAEAPTLPVVAWDGDE